MPSLEYSCDNCGGLAHTRKDCPSVKKRRTLTYIISVLEARKRVLVEVNVSADDLDAVVGALPCAR